MRIARLLPLFLLTCFLPVSSQIYSQNISNIKLDVWMCCDLDKAISEISNKYHLRFEYNTELFKGMSYNDHPINKPLTLFLEQLCRDYKLKYYISPEDSVIHIVDKWYSPEQELLRAPKNILEKPGSFDFSFSGRVVDKSTREPLPFVTIMVKGTTIGTSANVDGFLRWSKYPRILQPSF
jgi:ferric enterobactin receptor